MVGVIGGCRCNWGGLGSVDGAGGSGGFPQVCLKKATFSHRLRRTLPPKGDLFLCNPKWHFLSIISLIRLIAFCKNLSPW